MQFALTYAVITLVALVSTLFIIVLNVRHARSDMRQLNFRIVSIELLALTIWVTLFTRLLQSATPEEKLSHLILFLLAVAFGVLLIRGTLHEIRTHESVTQLLVKLNMVNKRLRDLDTQKTEFVSLTSHQLRGPLSAVQGHTSMILNGDFGEVPDHLRKPLERTFVSSKTLGGLLNDFLDVARIEKGEIDYKIEPFNVVHAVGDVMNDFELLCKQAELECKKTYTTKDCITVLGDPVRFKEVFSKVLDNAVKYTPSGSVTVSISIKHHDAVISIVDTGIGITRKDMDGMFHKFKRADNANDVSVTGSGLGLYAAKQMIEAQGGRIWVDSPGKNKGTRFYIALPLQE